MSYANYRQNAVLDDDAPKGAITKPAKHERLEWIAFSLIFMLGVTSPWWAPAVVQAITSVMP